MAETLPFSKAGAVWEAAYASEGDNVVQLERTAGGWLNVYANMAGMERKAIASWTHYEGGRNMIFKVCVPAGLTVTLESESEVTAAKRQAVE